MTYTPTLFAPRTVARAEAINAELQAIAAALADLPSGSAQAEGRGAYYVATGTADSYAITVSPAPAAYADGMCFTIKWPAANTGGAVTLNVNGLGARSVKFADGANPTSGAMASGGLGVVLYLGTTFYLIASTSAVKMAVVQTSATDTTTGAVMQVGAFGLGATGGVPALSGSIDSTTIANGDWRTSTTNTGTFPAGAAEGYLIVKRQASAVLMQEWQSVSSNDRWRRYYNGAWSSWLRDATTADTGAVGGSAQPLDATLTAFAALAGVADRLPYFTGADAFSLATFTAFGRTLVANANAADARTDLGLASGATTTVGTAATADVTTSSTDTTANRLLKVGDFGVGGVGPTIGNAAVTTNAIAPGTYRYDTGAGSSGGPTNATDGVLIHARNLNGEEVQTFITVAGTAPANPGVMFTRYRAAAGAWQSWKYPGIYDFGGDTTKGWIKFDNGLMIQHIEIDETAQDYDISIGGATSQLWVRGSPAYVTWTFDQAFSDEPRIIANMLTPDTRIGGVSVSTVGTTSARLIGWINVPGDSVGTTKFLLATAIGHWRLPS